MIKTILIGRDPECDVVITEDSYVSRQHAVLKVDASRRFFVSDCNSSSGTTVIKNGRTTPVSSEIQVSESDGIILSKHTKLSVRDVLARAGYYEEVTAIEIEEPTPSSSDKTRRCSFCAAVNKANASQCSSCGKKVL